MLVLSEQGEGRIRSEPLRVEGSLDDHEALIVVASTESVDHGALALGAEATLTETMERSLEGGDSLAALATAGPSRMSVTVTGLSCAHCTQREQTDD